MRLDEYVKVKDLYGISYLGPSEEYLIQLDALRPHLASKFPDIQIALICRDRSLPHLSHIPNISTASEIPDQLLQEEITYDGTRRHPIEMFLKECGITSYPVKIGDSIRTTRCVIITKGNYPTLSLTSEQIEVLKKIGKSEGYEVEIDTDVELSGLVMGVESLALFKAAVAGVETRLVPTGIGTRLYKTMFPESQILNI
jgi:hypothetical protein